MDTLSTALGNDIPSLNTLESAMNSDIISNLNIKNESVFDSSLKDLKRVQNETITFKRKNFLKEENILDNNSILSKSLLNIDDLNDDDENLINSYNENENENKIIKTSDDIGIPDEDFIRGIAALADVNNNTFVNKTPKEQIKQVEEKRRYISEIKIQQKDKVSKEPTQSLDKDIKNLQKESHKLLRESTEITTKVNKPNVSSFGLLFNKVKIKVEKLSIPSVDSFKGKLDNFDEDSKSDLNFNYKSPNQKKNLKKKPNEPSPKDFKNRVISMMRSCPNISKRNKVKQKLIDSMTRERLFAKKQALKRQLNMAKSESDNDIDSDIDNDIDNDIDTYKIEEEESRIIINEEDEKVIMLPPISKPTSPRILSESEDDDINDNSKDDNSTNTINDTIADTLSDTLPVPIDFPESQSKYNIPLGQDENSKKELHYSMSSSPRSSPEPIVTEEELDFNSEDDEEKIQEKLVLKERRNRKLKRLRAIKQSGMFDEEAALSDSDINYGSDEDEDEGSDLDGDLSELIDRKSKEQGWDDKLVEKYKNMLEQAEDDELKKLRKLVSGEWRRRNKRSIMNNDDDDGNGASRKSFAPGYRRRMFGNNYQNDENEDSEDDDDEDDNEDDNPKKTDALAAQMFAARKKMKKTNTLDVLSENWLSDSDQESNEKKIQLIKEKSKRLQDRIARDEHIRNIGSNSFSFIEKDESSRKMLSMITNSRKSSILGGENKENEVSSERKSKINLLDTPTKKRILRKSTSFLVKSPGKLKRLGSLRDDRSEEKTGRTYVFERESKTETREYMEPKLKKSKTSITGSLRTSLFDKL